MDSGHFRRTVAIVAAYAVALHTLLLAFVPMAAPLAGPFATLCSHDNGDGTGQPAQHDIPCAALCAALGQGVSGPLPPDVAPVVAELGPSVAVAPAAPWALPPITRTDPHAPRGPPLA